MPVEPPAQKIGVVEYSLPRSVQLAKRDAEDIRDTEMAVYGTFAVRVGTVKERERILTRWPEIMQHLSDGISTLLDDEDDRAEANE